jgi:hypothetical protein
VRDDLLEQCRSTVQRGAVALEHIEDTGQIGAIRDRERRELDITDDREEEA